MEVDRYRGVRSDSVNYVSMDPLKLASTKNTPYCLTREGAEVDEWEQYTGIQFFFLKYHGFQFENEYRLVALDSAFDYTKKNPNYGLTVNIATVDDFVEKVIMPPYASEWFEKAVKVIMDKFCCSGILEKSEFESLPERL